MEFSDTYFEDEVRDGFYVSSMMKRAWAAQLEVLDLIKNICSKHGIPYYAEWGTLLGAVRHGGMIPWDDDMDICMKRKDYIRFLSVLDEELPEECWFLDYRTSEDYDNMVGKLENSQTICQGEERLEKYHGFPFTAGVDFFPLDFLPPDGEAEESFQSLIKAIAFAITGLKGDIKEIKDKDLDYCIREIESVCHITFDRTKSVKQQLYDLLETKISILFQENEAKELTNLSYFVHNPNYRMPKAYYSQMVTLPFENTEISVPIGYEALLGRHKYGNYMKPIREGSTHEYPMYKQQQRYLTEELGIQTYQYQFSPEDGEREKGVPKETLQDRVGSFVPLFSEAHQSLKELAERGDTEACTALLADCQNVAIQIGTMIEEERGGDLPSVKILEEYCELLFHIHGCLMGAGGEKSLPIEGVYEDLLSFEKKFKDSMEGLKDRKEIVFVPYKAAYWNALDSVWQAAMKSEDTDVYVIPAPYYYKDVFGEVKKEEPHYEIEGYPEQVAITSYENYNFEVHHPDTIVIQCPYDEYNYALTVHPFFYAKNLRQYTEQLVYIPALTMDEIAPGDGRAREMLKAYCNMPGVVNADKVIVQSEQMKDVYVELLTEFAGEDTKELWGKKILGIGSPVYDYEDSIRKEDGDVPKEWLPVLQNPDGTWKKIILYTTSASALFCYGEELLDKMRETLCTFRDNREEVALIWRPDLKAREALRKSCPGLWQKYRDMVQEYRQERWGVYDDSSEPECAIAVCDACYGNGGTVLNACRVRKKPVLEQRI